jgi:alpha-galactosidase
VIIAAHPISCAIAADGSVTVTAGGFTLSGLYPAIDGIPLRPRLVGIERRGQVTSVDWQLTDGVAASLRIRTTADALHLRLQLAGLACAPRHIDILHRAHITGADRAWYMAQGMGGGSGRITLPSPSRRRSSACTAACSDDGSALGLWMEDHHRFLCAQHWDGYTLTATCDTEGIPLPDGTLELPELHLAWDADAWRLLTRMADAIGSAMGCSPRPRTRTWCSWYYYYHHFNRSDLDGVLAGLRSLPDRGGVATVQIDAGYCTSLGDWLQPNHLWPGGLQPAFASIAAAGYDPAVWIGPFMVGSRSRLAIEHPDWLLRDSDGALLAPIRNYGEHRLWHYPDEEYHVLDTSHPDAFAYMRDVIRTLVQWGVRYLKTDFLYWGLHDSTRVRRATPGKTSVEYLRDVMQMIRDELGPERYLLGCIAPHAPLLGLVDGQRIAGDIGPQWSGGFNPQDMLDESLHGLVVDGRWFHSDPDALLVRDFHSGFSPNEVEALALWQAMTGGNLCTSDPLHRCATDRQALWRFCTPAGVAGAAHVPRYATGPDERIVARNLGGGRTAVLAINTSEEPRRIDLPVADCVGTETTWIHPWGPGSSGGPWLDRRLTAELPAHSARLWLLAEQMVEPLPATLAG